jgi:hypothetical protein
MHPEIAAFPHERIYEGEALFTPEHMADERAWSFRRHAHRAIWLDVRGSFDGRFNTNPAEAGAVIDELLAFDAWAANNPEAMGGHGRPQC